LQLAVVVSIGYGILLAAVYLFQSRLLYFPNIAGTDPDLNPSRFGLQYEDVYFASTDGVRLHGWFVPAPNPRGILLFLHGNAGNITHRLDSIALFHALDLSVFIFDYRGYGKSSGRPGERGTYDDAAAAWKYLTRDRQPGTDQIVVFGRSLGASIGAELATHVKPAGLIIESAFTSVADIAAELYRFLPVRALVRFRYDTKSHIAGISCPLLVIHSADDEIIAVQHGQRLFAEAPEPKDYLEIFGDHNSGFLLSGSSYTEGLNEFLASTLGPARD